MVCAGHTPGIRGHCISTKPASCTQKAYNTLNDLHTVGVITRELIVLLVLRIVLGICQYIRLKISMHVRTY